MNGDTRPIVQHASQLLHEARVARTPVAQEQLGSLGSLATAYAVQAAGIGLRIQAGERVCGLKMGFTSRAKMAQMGVSEMIVGQLTDAMRAIDGGVLDTSLFIHPRVEPEVAVLLGRDLPAGASPDDFVRCVDAVAPALEVIDSRYANFRFDLNAVVADNTSAAAFVVGSWQPVSRSIDNLGLALRVAHVSEQGARSETQLGTTSAILGDPWRSVSAAARLAALHGLVVPAGSVVLAGAATAAVALPAQGRVELEMASLGRVRLWLSPTPASG
jgi:2-oxo-3-hexenedioate decarboxylase